MTLILSSKTPSQQLVSHLEPTMDDNSIKPNAEEHTTSEKEALETTASWNERGRCPSDNPAHILFAPEPRDRRQRSEDIAALTLTRTFSRQSRFSSYSTQTDEEQERVKRVASRRSVDPHIRLPTRT